MFRSCLSGCIFSGVAYRGISFLVLLIGVVSLNWFCLWGGIFLGSAYLEGYLFRFGGIISGYAYGWYLFRFCLLGGIFQVLLIGGISFQVLGLVDIFSDFVYLGGSFRFCFRG